MDAIEVELSPGSAVKFTHAYAEHRVAGADEGTDCLSRDQYYCNYGNRPITLPKSFCASATSPSATVSTAADDLHEADTSSIPSPLLLEMQLDTILRGDCSSERGGSLAGCSCNSSSAVQQTALRNCMAEPRVTKPSSSTLHSSTELTGEAASSPLHYCSTKPHHTGPGCTLSLRPPPLLSYVTCRSHTKTGSSAPRRVPLVSAAVPAPPVPFRVPEDASETRPPMSASPSCLPRGRRAAMQESIARFLNVEEAMASDTSSAVYSTSTSCSPICEPFVATVASAASPSLPRASAREENNKKHHAADLPLKTAAMGNRRPHMALFAPLPVNQTRTATSRAHASKATVSTTSPISCVGSVGNAQRDGCTTLVATSDVIAKAELTQLPSSSGESARKSANFSLLPYTDSATLASFDAAAGMSAEGPLGAVEVRVYDKATVTVTCVACQLSINVFALLLAGTELPDVCYCPLCGSRCKWTACTDAV
ncbi:hypothetical protein LBRM_28_0930 [Leishmania braziliensis MHOM/BR/75/M2904]|uniref:Uncharacterized protein n=2 Tax=Leishmania braziliensis TaxID=5660 RepID=A4HGD0_LEIBR|nr:hypothetical protein LBRM_28_0930 [Leishmania braziliensis MHOM/BR/75/M2904]CAJ2475735.1 unnamed protein product [Leishmania braziliensis]CAM39623.1 hypothetical protein LBRM_28_0930 [Leishmania braziliensis MHOM/BR/75/M2904]SYZ67282.1 hypothetical_protein [Leishmania braziliensis MHOM/BR/75/M2904]